MEDQALFGVVDYVVFGFLLFVSALIGVWFGFFAKQKQDSTEEYLMGGKTMGVFPISMSLIASSISGISMLTLPAEMYVYGTQFYMIVGSEVIATLMMVFVYMPVFYKLQTTSSYEFMYIPIVIYVPGLAFSSVTGINVHLITPIVCVVCIFYTTVGGLKAVVWTDTLQTVLMYGGIITVMVLGTIQVGGFAEVFERSRNTQRLDWDLDLDPTVRATFWTVLIGYAFNAMSWYAVNQAMMQRCLAMPTLRNLHTMFVIFVVGMFCLLTMCCYTGVLIFAYFHDCDPMSTKRINKVDQLLPYFVLQISTYVPGLTGLFVAGVFSAALSTMSTGLNSMTGVISEDMIRPLLKRPITEKQASNYMKVMAAVIGVVCTALVLLVEKMGTILQVGMSLNSVTSGALLGVFTLGMLFPWANNKGAISGCVASVLVVAWLSFGQQLAIAEGNIVYPEKPVSQEGCPNLFNTTTYNLTTTLVTEAETVSLPYRISFLYYTMIGCLTAVVVGLVVSFMTGPLDPRDVNPDVLSPVIHRFLPRRDVSATEKELEPLKQRPDIMLPALIKS